MSNFLSNNLVKGFAAGVLGVLLTLGAAWSFGKVYYYVRVVWAVEKILVHNERPARI